MTQSPPGSEPPAPAETLTTIVAPMAEVAPTLGSAFNLLTVPGVSGTLLADFQRTGTVADPAVEYLARTVRPGAILLANLDISDPSRLPRPFPSDLAPFIDGHDNQVNGPADEADFTMLRVQSPTIPGGIASRIVVRVDVGDARRIRMFEKGSGEAPVLGAGAPGRKSNEAQVPAPVGTNYSIAFQVEATTLPGDPTCPPPQTPVPSPPCPYLFEPPPNAELMKPLYPSRAPGDIWLELVHQDSAGNDLPVPRDAAVFTIAPFLLLSNLQPIEQAYVVYAHDYNHEFVYDLAEALKEAIGGIAMPPDTSTAFATHLPPHAPDQTPESTPGSLYIIDAGRYPDVWIQDEMEIGYSFAPHRWMHVVLHCKRNRQLAPFVCRELLAPGIGLFDALAGPRHDGPDYGGNIEVSPPVMRGTPAMPRDAAGPSVKAHRPALSGKMIMGDCTPRPQHLDVHNFFVSQRVQPVLPVDTSWLHVGHIDEIMTFVPSTQGRRHLMLFASVVVMDVLLSEAGKVSVADGRTNFHRGKYVLVQQKRTYAEVSLERLLRGPVGAYSRQIQEEKLDPILLRLQTGLDIADEEVILLPTYFALPEQAHAPLGSTTNRTVAETVNSVNMLVARQHLLIPRPFGPRLRAADCRAVLERAFAQLDMGSFAVQLPSNEGFWFWAPPHERLENLAAYFVHPSTESDRDELIAYIRSNAPPSLANMARIAAMAAVINAHPNNAAPPLATVLDATGTFTAWRRVFIPEPTVDLLEAYMLSVLTPHGLALHFIDDFWPYHAHLGEVHCGTNARRTPPDPSLIEPWWRTYDPSYDVSYDPAS